MIKKLHKTIILCGAAFASVAMLAGCSHPADSGASSLDQQKAGVMGAPAPPEVQAQIAQQQAAERAAMQQGAQQAQQQAKQAGQTK